MIAKLRELIAIMRRVGVPLRAVAYLLGLSVLSTLAEGAAMLVLLPIFQLLRSGGTENIAKLTGRHWDILRELSFLTGIPITLGLLLAISFSFLLVRQFLSYVNGWYLSDLQREVTDKVRQRMIRGFLRAQSTVQDQTRIGEIAAVVTTELDRAIPPLLAVVRASGVAFQVVIYIIGLFFLSAWMTTISIFVIAIVATLSRRFLARIKKLGAKISDANADLTSFVIERLRHARLIRLSGTEKAEIAAVSRLSREHSEHSLKQKLVASRLALIPDPIALGFGYLAIYLGGEVFGLSLERLGLFMVVLIRIMPLVRKAIAEHGTTLGKWSSLEAVDENLKMLAEEREPRGGDRSFTVLDHGIEYDHVSFSYDGSNAAALSNVTVTLPAHQMSALIGPSGAGKSTFVDLLPRLRNPSAGRILFDGVPIDEFSTDTLRAGIGFVPQQPQIFNITAAEHIRYGKEDADDSEVREAARLAGALDFIEALPNGFDTLLGDGGKQLSGGQRQRLDIARALARRAPILILDEPTSALDAGAEAAFRDALQRLRVETDLTIIVIAHRLSTIVDADQIVVINKGRIEAVGSHDELMATGGWYTEASRHQADRPISDLPIMASSK